MVTVLHPSSFPGRLSFFHCFSSWSLLSCMMARMELIQLKREGGRERERPFFLFVVLIAFALALGVSESSAANR